MRFLSTETKSDSVIHGVVIQHFVRLLQDQVAEGKHAQVKELISILIGVAENHARHFFAAFKYTVAPLCDIALNPMTDNDLRRLALELALRLAEKAPALAREVPNNGYLRTVLPVALRMLLEHGEGEPSLAEWEDLDTIDENAAGFNIPIGKEAVLRIGHAIGAERFLGTLGVALRAELP
jgi:hypothetical protein